MNLETLLTELLYYEEQLAYWKAQRRQIGSLIAPRTEWNLFKYARLCQANYRILAARIDQLITDHELYESIYE